MEIKFTPKQTFAISLLVFIWMQFEAPLAPPYPYQQQLTPKSLFSHWKQNIYSSTMSTNFSLNFIPVRGAKWDKRD